MCLCAVVCESSNVVVCNHVIQSLRVLWSVWASAVDVRLKRIFVVHSAIRSEIDACAS